MSVPYAIDFTQPFEDAFSSLVNFLPKLLGGLVILAIGLIALGAAMLGAPAFGKRMGRTTVALGAVGLAAASALLVDVSPLGVLGVFALIVFHLVLGWRVHKLSRAPHSRTLADA